MFKEDDNTDLRMVRKFTMVKVDFNQFFRLRNQLFIAAENFGREVNLSPLPIPTMSQDMDEQLKLAHKVIGVADRAKRKICVALLW